MTLAHTITLSHAPDGGAYDICNPAARPIDYGYVATKLARIIRFNGEPGAISVAQHAVLGAEALVAEGADPFIAALYLHHDDHAFILGDQTRAAGSGISLLAPDAGLARETLKANWDRAIYAGLKLPSPDMWNHAQAAAVAVMSLRMNSVEQLALFGPRAVAHLPPLARRTPRFNAALSPPWPAEKAAEAWKTMHRKLTGRTIR
ncbi:MAG: hypothetical protein JWR80_7970 [Bradyrhizobium sp.]|nr:hypothetical protein [Bradyrhizobium sp.]